MKLFGVFLGGLCLITGLYGLHLAGVSMLLALAIVFGVWLIMFSMEK